MTISSSRRNRGRRLLPTVAIVALVTLFSPFIAFQPAVAGIDDDELTGPVQMFFTKTATPAPPSVVEPGETVSYSITLTCSSLTTICIDATVTDAVPQPLVLQTVTASGRTTEDVAIPVVTTRDGNGFTVEAQEPFGDLTGLADGTEVSILVTALLPSDVSSDWDAQTLTNTATVTVSNREDLQSIPPRPSTLTAEADVLLAVDRVLGSDTSKEIIPESTSAVVGRTVDFILGATNTSNGSVDELVIQEPSDTSSSILDYIEITGLSELALPAGADRVRVDWFDGTDWVPGVAGPTAVLPAGVDTADIRGLRIVFSSSTGRVDRGATGGITIDGTLTATAAAISAPLNLTNTASSWVRLGGTTTSPEPAADVVRIEPSSVAPVATKQFESTYVIGGALERVTIGGQNGGDFPLKELTITEPAPGSTSLADQGLSFDSWITGGIEWPVSATSAEVSYWYEGDADFSAPITTTTVDTLPAPVDAALVQSIRIRFLTTAPGGMTPGQFAVLPFFVTTDAVVSDLTSTNQVRVDVVTLDDQTATAVANDDLTRRTVRVNTTVDKVVSPDELYSIAGATTLVSLPSSVAPFPSAAVDPNASTVGSVSLVISDPIDPELLGADQFWNYFDLTDIVATSVPANTVLSVEYYDGDEWLALPGATGLLGPTFVNRSIDPALRDEISGIRFVYQHRDYDSSGTLLSPGFSAVPYLRFGLRSDLRDGSGEAASSTRLDALALDNTVVSRVSNPAATPPEAAAMDTAVLELLPTTDGGTGGDGDGAISAIRKQWQVDTVNARSADRATVRINWGTAGTPFDSVVLSDTASDPSTTPVEQTVFEAFDLVRVPAITSGMDPLLTFDRVVAVQLFLPGTGWVNASNDPCPASCDGTFPGLTLTDAQSDAATGVRLIIDESPTRASRIANNPAAPPVGSGVATSMALDRRFDLVFEVRDVKRSDPGAAVLGNLRGALYNTASEGVVDNTARFEGRDVDEQVQLTRTAADTILILDQPINVDVTKSWVDGPLGTPPDGTPAELYPRARMTIDAQNLSVSRVDELSIIDPIAPTEPFDALNIFDIVTISVPTGATSTVVYLQRESGPSPTTHTRTQALNLTPGDLVDVVGIEVVHTGRIAVEATARLVIDTQLREYLRSAPTERATQSNTGVNNNGIIDNTARAVIADAGGLCPIGDADCDADSVITSQDQDSAQIAVQNLEYGVTATKSIQANTTSTADQPAIQYDGDSRVATLTLTGRPTGNVRSTDMVFEDITPSFWNAVNFNGFGAHTRATPIDQVRVDALVGVEYVIDPVDGSIDVECGGSDVLDACWRLGTFGPNLVLPVLQSGETVDQIRGLRFHYNRADGAAWERPFNPLQTVRFTVIRRDTLVTPQIPVPSTLYIYEEPAPGEDDPGLFTNQVVVTAYVDDDGEGWGWRESAQDSRQLLFQHRPAEVRIVKTPADEQLLGTSIPYEIAVTNLGTGQDKDLAEIEIVDRIPADDDGPMLVFANDPDTNLPYDPEDVIELTLTNTAGTAVAAPSFTASLGILTDTEWPLTITVDPAFVLPKGWTLTFEVPLQFRPLFAAGSATTGFALNTATVTTDQPFDRCEYSTNGVLEPVALEKVETCTSETRVWALPSAPMSIIKGVKGVEAGPLDVNGDPVIDPATSRPFDDLGVIRTVNNGQDCPTSTFTVAANGNNYYRFPCVPITRPGGREEWVASFFNAGNVEVKRVVAIDVLPRENDRGVIIDDPRSSRWAAKLLERPRLLGAPDPSTMTVYYTARTNLATVACNGADIQAELGMGPTSIPPMVSTYQPCIDSPAAGGLPDRDDPTAGWQVMPDAPDAALLESVVALKFVIDLGVGPDGLAPGDTLTIAYQTRTAIEPALRETSNNLARDSIAYNSIAGAARGLEDGTDYPYRFVLEPRKAGVALATGAIDLQKLVEGPGVAFAPDTVDIALACTVDIDGPDGDEFAPQPISLLTSTGANRSPFTITADAAPTRILGIPLYAECSVSEVGPTGATETSAINETVRVRAVQEANPGSLVFNPRPAFGADRDPVLLSQFTNTYELAGLTISKTVDMNGALNASGQPVMQTGFQFSVSCVFDNGSGPQSVLSVASLTLNNGQSQTYTGLPAGSVCTVTETQTRGATVTTVTTTGGAAADPVSGTTAVVTLAPDDLEGEPTNRVDVTNDIAVGSLTVSKLIRGAAATAPYAFGAGPFTIQVSCTRTGVNVWLGTLTFTPPNGFVQDLNQTIDNIPAGSRCTLTEPANGGATNVSIQGAIDIVGNSTVTRTVTNRFDLASLTVGKTVATAAEDEDGNAVYPVDPFEFSVACTFRGDTVLGDGFASSPMTFSLQHSQTRTLTGLPAGASCTVTETDDRDADSTVISRTVNTTTTSITGTSATIASLAANGTNPVTRNSTQFTNNYGVTSFTISKDVIGGGGTQFAPASFTATLVCTSPLVGESFNGTVTVTADEPATISNLADGSVCTVAEVIDPPTGADAHRIVDDAGEPITGEDIVVTAAQPASVTLENYYMTGELEVSKTVLGAGAAYGDGPFEVTLVCQRDGIDVDIAGGATREMLADDTVSYTLLPSGAECTLTESDPAGATSSRILDENGAVLTEDVGEGRTFTVEVAENQFDVIDNQPQPSLEVENTFELAGLSVTKTVSSDAVDADGAAIGYGPFPVAVDCTFQGDDVYGDGYDSDTPMQRDLDDGETWSLAGLPEGASCTITETDTMDAAETRIVTAVDGGGSSTIVADFAVVTLGSVTTAEIENDYTVGSIELAKSVVGAGADDWADAPFVIDVTCVLDDSTGERTVFADSFTLLRGDDPVTIENLATGALCTLTETSTGGASSTTVTIDGVTVDGTTADVVVADELIEATVTNTFALGEVRVEKVRDGDGAPTWGAGPFEVELTCVRDIDGVEQQIEVPGGALRELTVDGFYEATYSDLPLDAVCSLVETRSAGATSTSIDVDTVTITAEPVGFTVTNTFDVGSVAVEKTFDGDGTGLFVQGPYEATLACTLDIDGVVTELEIPGGAARELTELNGYRNTWNQIPAGAQCTVTESRTGGATRVETTDAEFVVVADDEHTVSIENVFMLAAFSITKDVTGPFANEARDAVFTIETSCMWERDGELVPMLPGGWPGEPVDPEAPIDPDAPVVDPATSVTSQIRDGVTVTFDDLPANSVCSITEVDSGGATGQLVWLGGVLQLGDLTLADGLNDSILSNVFMITLAETGVAVEIMLWLWVIAALLFGGMVMLAIARRRAEAAEAS